MNSFIAGLLGVLLATAAVSAQEAPARRERPGPAGGPEEQAHGTRDPGFFVDRLLQAVRSKDPAEADRLSELRKTDPEAFRQELRAKVIEFRRAPPPEGQGRDSRPPRDGRPSDRPPRADRDADPERPEMAEIRLLVGKYRETDAEPEKEQIMSRLREIVRGMIVQRQEDRRGRIARFERELEEMKTDLARIDSEMDQIVDRRIQEILRNPRRPDRPKPEPPTAVD
ncbi:MAG: hypothetical protein KBA51_03920 [Kiritimatiellae bacterium]|nr:hypothetical protein [Kiritimatiellia bacterium]